MPPGSHVDSENRSNATWTRDDGTRWPIDLLIDGGDDGTVRPRIEYTSQLK